MFLFSSLTISSRVYIIKLVFNIETIYEYNLLLFSHCSRSGIWKRANCRWWGPRNSMIPTLLLIVIMKRRTIIKCFYPIGIMRKINWKSWPKNSIHIKRITIKLNKLYQETPTTNNNYYLTTRATSMSSTMMKNLKDFSFFFRYHITQESMQKKLIKFYLNWIVTFKVKALQKKIQTYKLFNIRVQNSFATRFLF